MIHELIEHKTMGIQKIGGFHGKNSTQALLLDAFRLMVYIIKTESYLLLRKGL
jgi:hypothetical protein